MSGSGFADGIEFEETFPDAAATAPAAHEPAPRVTSTPAPSPVIDATEALYQDRLERRLREAESMVKRTIERMRLDEEQRLLEWAETRRAEEERRLTKWTEERRVAIERSIEEGLALRKIEEARLAQSRRVSDEQRLQQWRTELEKTLQERVAQPQNAGRAGFDGGASLSDRVAATTSARDVGRLLRDEVADVARTTAFALSVLQNGRDDVAYRYRVASDDELGALLRRDALDDGPQSAVVHLAGWARASRAVQVGPKSVMVHTSQLAVRVNGSTVGVLTLQTENDDIADSVLAQIADRVAACASHLAALRDNGSFRSL